MQTQPGARSRSREGGNERHVSLGLSSSGVSNGKASSGGGRLEHWAGARTRAGARGRKGRFLGNGPSLARDPLRACSGRMRLRPSRCRLLPVTSVPPSVGEAQPHHLGFPGRGWPAGETEAWDPDGRLHCAHSSRNRRPRPPTQRGSPAQPGVGRGPVADSPLGSACLKSAERVAPHLQTQSPRLRASSSP
ncbi:uncharacterized protein LOC144581835 [Callithrix jacchus]